jgi:hypothetical protein
VKAIAMLTRFVMQPDEMSPKEALERIYQLKKLV